MSERNEGDALEAAIALAARVHAGQVDKAGAPYIRRRPGLPTGAMR